MKIAALLFGGPMDGKTMMIPHPTEFINIPLVATIPRDETGRFAFDSAIPTSSFSSGKYVYDPERSNHNLVSENLDGASEVCYRWDGAND